MDYKHYPDENINEIITYAEYNADQLNAVNAIGTP